ncbi:stage II sporulation protein M [Lacunimicrobium album]
MKIAEVIAIRQKDWKELESEIHKIRGKSIRRIPPEELLDFGRRYRAICSDLSMALSMGFPPETTRYLHQLVADGHALIYRSQTFRLRDWGKVLFLDVPARIVTEPCTWIAMSVFWGLFLGSMLGAIFLDNFSAEVVGESTLTQMESMYSEPIGLGSTEDTRSMMTGFYVFNNAGIGLQCFAYGIFFGVGSLFVLAFNAIFLGAIFGHMLSSPQAGNFVNFVTSHGPFELTAVALSAGAGLKLGWSIIDTSGWSRGDSLRRNASEALELALTASVLFILAAMIEGNFSPLPLPYEIKAAMAIICTILLLIWLSMPWYLSNRKRRSSSLKSREVSDAA